MIVMKKLEDSGNEWRPTLHGKNSEGESDTISDTLWLLQAKPGPFLSTSMEVDIRVRQPPQKHLADERRRRVEHIWATKRQYNRSCAHRATTDTRSELEQSREPKLKPENTVEGLEQG